MKEINDKEPTLKEIKELKKTWRGKWQLYKKGLRKFREDPPLYRIPLFQGLSTMLTIYMIIFASIYAVSIGFWVFALIILPVGVLGNWYSMRSYFMNYRDLVKQFEMAGILKPIEEDISNLRKRFRIIEKQVGFFFVHVIFAMFTIVLSIAYFGRYTLGWKIGIVFASLPVLLWIYFVIFYKICNYYYQDNKLNERKK